MSNESKPARISRWELWTTALAVGSVIALGNRVEKRFNIHGYHLILLILAEVATIIFIPEAARLFIGKLSRVRSRPK
jgi:hypothetical protein